MSAPYYSNQQLFDLIGSGQLCGNLATRSNYLIVVSPGDEICEKVRQLKQRLKPLLGGNRSVHSMAHLTMINLLAPFYLEARIIKALTRACNAIVPQTVTVDGFDSFPNGDGRNVIFLKIVEEFFFTQIQRQIKWALHAEGINRRYAQLSGRPHITIVKDLSDRSFTHCQQKLASETYHDSFKASELVVLKRQPGSYTKCDPLEPIPFTGSGTSMIEPAPKQVHLL